MGWELASDRAILVDIEEIVAPFHTENIGRQRLDSCCSEMRTLSILPRSLSDRDSATYHLSNHFRIKTPSLLFSIPRFVSVWPAPEVVDGSFEVCSSASKFCPSVNKPVALGFSL